MSVLAPAHLNQPQICKKFTENVYKKISNSTSPNISTIGQKGNKFTLNKY